MAFLTHFVACCMFKTSSLSVLNATKAWGHEVFAVFWTLLKIMLPMLLIVRFIELMGWVEHLSALVAPMMALMGLPGEVGFVWMSAMVSNIYTGMAVFYQLGLADSLTVAQVSVMSTIILIAHALPMEVAIANATGVRWWFTMAVRVVGALILGIVLNLIYTQFDLLNQPLSLVWQPEIPDNTWPNWLATQAQILLAAFVIIAALTLTIRLLRFLHIERLIHWLMAPVLRMMGIGSNAANFMIVGLTLGISFGGGLIINEARSGQLNRQDIFMVMFFLALCHSVIEDTLLMMLIGADLSAILWARLIFALAATALLARLLPLVSERFWNWLFRPKEIKPIT